MAERKTSSPSSAERITKPHVAQPFNVSKKKLRKDHSDSEKEKIKKHEIQGERFAYRLHSVKDILKKINDDQENEEQNDPDARKKRRRSNLQRGKRKSIAETVLIKNLQKEIENESAAAKSGANREAISDEKQENASVQKRPKKSISNTKLVSEEETVAAKEHQLERRKDILEKILILKQEQEAWTELYATYQDRLSKAKSNQSEPTSNASEEFFTEEHRQFLKNRIKPGEFIERLKNYRDDYMIQVEHTREFLCSLQTFKKRAAEYLKSVNIVADDKGGEGDINTPRRLIAKVAQAEPSSS
eukprot:Seg609.9 transcript_id=Seg609.9/GoldUCD/mRNA.D3Y31 product="hypothetical protein" protein_id=Seg609.9/GoldUCD/D3Y31